jgi:hypothetical protein
LPRKFFLAFRENVDPAFRIQPIRVGAGLQNTIKKHKGRKIYTSNKDRLGC